MAYDVVHLAGTRYPGANHTHLSELLRDREGIDLARPTVRRILTRAGIPSPRHRRPPKHRVRRQRMPQAGMLVQIDGSFHRWLGDDGPQFTLLLAVDDATSAVVNAVFGPEEDTRGYFTLLQELIERWGRPIALYGDRHGVFKFSGKPRHIQPPVEATHFSKAIAELGIHQIFARSPQAKGRVERAAGTFQDRLVTELRLADAIPSTKPTPCCGTSCPATTPSLPSLPNLPIPPTVRGARSALWMRSLLISRVIDPAIYTVIDPPWGMVIRVLSDCGVPVNHLLLRLRPAAHGVETGAPGSCCLQ